MDTGKPSLNQQAVSAGQMVLSEEQLLAFQHDEYVDKQVRHFRLLVPSLPERPSVVDVGGGYGFFANRVEEEVGRHGRLIDSDSAAVNYCTQQGIDAELGDAIRLTSRDDDAVVWFNLIPSHPVASSERGTYKLQSAALSQWGSGVPQAFVNEFIYESFVFGLSRRLIHEITRGRVLSWIGRKVAKVIRAFAANAFGIGVRFSSLAEWRRLFALAGSEIKRALQGEPEEIFLPLRSLFIRQIRRDSFVLAHKGRAYSSKAPGGLGA